jgi:hypothetical protein
MAVGQTTFTVANGAVLQLHAGGNMADYLSGDPDATAFRYTSVRFTSFGMAWFFENFDKGAASYLGEALTYTASRNCDIHEMTLFRYELPGIGNFQTYSDSQPSHNSGGTLNAATGVYTAESDAPRNEAQVYEILHNDICPVYQALVSHTTTVTKMKLHLLANTGITGTSTTETNVKTTSIGVTAAVGNFRREKRSSCVAESFFESTDSTNFYRLHQGQPYYTDGVALAAVKHVEYKVGGQRMDRHDKYALYTWILLNSGSIGVPFDMCGLASSTANNNIELKSASMSFQVKYCPLIFSFCRAPSMGAPLISNMYNNLIIEAEFEAFSALICNYSGSQPNHASGVSAVRTYAGLNGDGTPLGNAEHRAYPLAHHKDYAGATIAAMPAGTQFFTKKRYLEDTLENSYSRGRDVRTGRDLPDVTASTSATIVASDLAQSDFGVSVVSRVFFLGPEERTAFASNSFSQTVEACQRIVHSTTQTTTKTYRTDTFQNASSVMYVVPVFKPNRAASDYFSMGGAYDVLRQQTWPAINSIDLSTNGATLYAQSDESFFRQVQAYAHHSNVLDPGRRVYAINFGTRANSRGPVQSIGYLNFSRTTNSQVTIRHATNMWVAKSTDETRSANGSLSRGNLYASSSTQLDIEFILWNYNLLTYKGGIAGYRYTQSNNSL